MLYEVITISTGGAEIYDADNNAVYSRAMDPALVKKLMQYADRNSLHFQVYIDGNLVFRETNKYAQTYEHSCGLKGIVRPVITSYSIHYTKLYDNPLDEAFLAHHHAFSNPQRRKSLAVHQLICTCS